jgi:hypothetical protein
MKRLFIRKSAMKLAIALSILPVLAVFPGDFHVGLSGGVGLPKVPYSGYRLPVSVLAGAFAQQPLTGKWMLRGEACGLTTIHFGTWNGSDLPLRFNLLWASADGCFRMSGFITSATWLEAGIGWYKLDQRFGDNTAKLGTAGFNVGILTQQTGFLNRTVFDIRWHLLFNPSPNPQVFTITLGFLL